MKIKKLTIILLSIMIVIAFMPWSVFAEESEFITEDTKPAIEEIEEASEVTEEPVVADQNENTESPGEKRSIDKELEDISDNEKVEKEVTYDEVKDLKAESDIIDSGTCGANLTWTLDSDGQLTISGTGEMDSFSSYNGSPWYSNRSIVSTVIIENDVTSIGNYAFWGCSSLTDITLPESVTSIGGGAFLFCSSLTSITIPDNVTSIGSSAFSSCKGLTSITLPDGVTSIGDSAFKDCSVLTSIDIPDGVTSIRDSVFEGCSSLTSITIPDSVTSIADFAFSECSSLTSVTLPENLTTLSPNAFQECSSLTSVTLSENLTTVSAYVFQNCSSLTSIYIPDSVTSIEYGAFSGCNNLSVVRYGGSQDSWKAISIKYDNTNLQNATIYYNIAAGTCGANLTWTLYSDGQLTISGTGEMDSFSSYNGSPWYSNRSIVSTIIIENDVTSIGNYAFWGCSSLTDMTLPESVTSIGNSAFYGCSNLANITIPDNVTSIGSSAFSGCSSLTSVTLSENMTTVSACVFQNCSSLTSIYIPDSVTIIEADAFSGCSRLTSITLPDSVTSIWACAFWDCSSLTSINIPDSVTSITDMAFYGCSSLTSVTLSENLTTLSPYVFQNCSNLTSIYIPKSVTTIETGAFSECNKLSVVNYGGSQASWGAINIALDNTNLQNATINYKEGIDSGTCGDNLTWTLSSDERLTISGTGEMYSFAVGGSPDHGSPWYSYRNNISTVLIDNGVTSIGNNAFSGCSSLTSINIPESVTKIGTMAFGSCRSLTSITLPESVTIIGDGAFQSCSSLTSINIPRSVTSIGDSTFYGCSSLTSVMIPDSVTSIGERAFFRCSNLTGIDIPESVTSIGNYAFYNCSNLTGIDIPESVTSIGNYAFYNCSSLTSVTIPDSVTSIGDAAFSNCSNLIKIKCNCGSFAQEWADSQEYTTEITHKATKEADIDPTCTESGLIQAEYCSVCGMVLKEKEVIPATGHNFGEWIIDKEATCTEEGIKHRECSICGYIESESINMAEHAFSEEYTIDQAATCTTDGSKSYHCTNEGCIATTGSIVISALGHDWGDPTYEWAADNSSVTATRTCKRDASHVETETVNTTSEVTKAATCEAKGETTYTATFTNEAFAVQTKALENIDALGHDWGDPTYEWAEDNSSVTATFTCKNDVAHKQTAEAEVTSETIPATHGEAGKTVYTATVTFEEETYTVVREEALESEPEFKTHSLVLSGQIGVNFFMDLPYIEGVDYSKSYMEFTVNGVSQRADLKESFKNPSGYYGFTCYVNSIQMAETIDAVFHYGNGKTVSQEYSIEEYVNTFEKNKDKVQDEDMIAVVERMADYGHYVQPFLSAERGWTIGNEYAEMTTYFTDSYDHAAIKSAVADYAIIRDNNDPDIAAINYQLALDSETEVYVLFRPTEGYKGEISFTVDDKAAEAEVQSDGRYLVKISGISAHLLGKTNTVVATTTNGSATAKVSAMSYVKAMLDNYTAKSYLDAAASLYKYFEAADNYKKTH